MKSICVYLGAKPGKNNRLSESVITLGQQIAINNYRLIYGGSSQGLIDLLQRLIHYVGGNILVFATFSIIYLPAPNNAA